MSLDPRDDALIKANARIMALELEIELQIRKAVNATYELEVRPLMGEVVMLRAQLKPLQLAVDAAIGALEDDNASDALTYLKTAKGLQGN